MKNLRHAPPRAGSMVESLRGIGYSTATAIADIVDNSIAAKANRIDIEFTWNDGQKSISILDDGSGMDSDELLAAMTLGAINPLLERDINDLGRFGFGLKTASFSQCRSLIVASKKNNLINCLGWDLDVIASKNDWYLLEGVSKESEYLLNPLQNSTSGTLVIWENLDRIIKQGYTQQDWLDLMEEITEHLAMVFHRYLGREKKLTISINKNNILPWDPFLISHPATWYSLPRTINTPTGGKVTIRCYVLPHKDKLTEREYEMASGPHGWSAQQGFYVYRNERLLVHGGWLGLRGGQGKAWAKEEAHHLARIGIDITNLADSDWKIDILKSKASPPAYLKNILIDFANDACKKARKVYSRKSQKISISRQSKELLQAWRADHYTGGIRYRIDTNHPLVKMVLENAGDADANIRAMFRVIEETIPVQRIWVDKADEYKETPSSGFQEANLSEISDILKLIYNHNVTRSNMQPNVAKDQLLITEPFQNFPELIAKL